MQFHIKLKLCKSAFRKNGGHESFFLLLNNMESRFSDSNPPMDLLPVLVEALKLAQARIQALEEALVQQVSYVHEQSNFVEEIRTDICRSAARPLLMLLGTAMNAQPLQTASPKNASPTWRWLCGMFSRRIVFLKSA